VCFAGILLVSGVCVCVCVFRRDIFPILKNPKALTAVIDLFEEHVRNSFSQLDLIVGKRTIITGSAH